MSSSGSALSGMVICMSGKLSKTRKEMEKLIKVNGGAVSSSITKKTTHLISTLEDLNAMSNKIVKAQERNIPILKEQFLYDVIEKSNVKNVDLSQYELGKELQQGQPTQKQEQIAAGATTAQEDKKEEATITAPPATTTTAAPTTATTTATTTTTTTSVTGAPTATAPPPPATITTPNPAVTTTTSIDSMSEEGKAQELRKETASVAEEEKREGEIAANHKRERSDLESTKEFEPPRKRRRVAKVDEDFPQRETASVVYEDDIPYDATLRDTKSDKRYKLQMYKMGDREEYAVFGKDQLGQQDLKFFGNLEEAKREFESRFQERSQISWKDYAAGNKADTGDYIVEEPEEQEQELKSQA